MRTIGILLSLSVIVGCQRQRVDIVAETAALHARSEAVMAAEAAKNTELALTFWAPDAIVQPAGSPKIQGTVAIRGLYNSLFAGDALKQFEGRTAHLEVAASGDLGYEFGVNRMVLAGAHGDLLDVGKYLIVWKKIDGQWYVAAISFTSDAPAPVPLPPS